MHECPLCSSDPAAVRHVRSLIAADQWNDGCDCSRPVFQPLAVNYDGRAQSRAYIQLYGPPA